MNEKEYFKKMIHDCAANDALVKARAKYTTRKTFAWTKALGVAAIACAVLIGTVFAIPSARAEVLSWFGVSTPRDYLTANPEDRTDIPEIDALIVSPEPGDGFVAIPIDRTDSKAVNSEGALKLSDFFYENDDIALGEAMFDGQYFYQAVKLNGLSGLYLLEEYTGGWQTGVPVDPYAVWGLYENGPDKEYLTGKWTLYERPQGRIFYELPDGTQLVGSLDLSGALEPYYHSLDAQGLIGPDAPEDAQEQIDAQNRRYLEQNGLTAVAAIWPGENIADHADENGNLKVRVFYEVRVCEEERGDGSYVPSTELFRAQLGTITVNVRAHRDLEAGVLESADGAIAWGAETVTLSKLEEDLNGTLGDKSDDCMRFSKYRVSMEGVAMWIDAKTAEINPLGIFDIQIHITVPETWTRAEREALAASLKFTVLINDEAGAWFPQNLNCVVQESGELLWTAKWIDGVPYEMLSSVKSISFVPSLTWVESWNVVVNPKEPVILDRDPVTGKTVVIDAKGAEIVALNPAFGETVVSPCGVDTAWSTDTGDAEFPEYTIMMYVE